MMEAKPQCMHHGGEMGDTGGEGLVPALSGGDPQDGSHNENIGRGQ